VEILLWNDCKILNKLIQISVWFYILYICNLDSEPWSYRFSQSLHPAQHFGHLQITKHQAVESVEAMKEKMTFVILLDVIGI